MAALEEQGYLSHPHTSCRSDPHRHRLPPLRGLAPGRRPAPRFAATRDRGLLRRGDPRPGGGAEGSVQLLSRLTQYAGLAVPPSAADEAIMRLELIDMGPTLMVLAVGQHGRVDKRMLDRPELDEPRPRRHRATLASLRGLRPTPKRRSSLLQLAAERPDQHDLLLHVAETLRSATQRRRRATWSWAASSNLADEAKRGAARRSGACSRRSRGSRRSPVLQDVSEGPDELASRSAQSIRAPANGTRRSSPRRSRPATRRWERSAWSGRRAWTTCRRWRPFGRSRKRLSELVTELEK